jgi:hypothetical protein
MCVYVRIDTQNVWAESASNTKLSIDNKIDQLLMLKGRRDYI